MCPLECFLYSLTFSFHNRKKHKYPWPTYLWIVIRMEGDNTCESFIHIICHQTISSFSSNFSICPFRQCVSLQLQTLIEVIKWLGSIAVEKLWSNLGPRSRKTNWNWLSYEFYVSIQLVNKYFLGVYNIPGTVHSRFSLYI